MRTSEKLSQTRGYVSPSISSDIGQESSLAPLANISWQGPVALMVGGWLFKRFPKASILGLLAGGAYLGYTMLNKKDKNPFKGEGIADLH